MASLRDQKSFRVTIEGDRDPSVLRVEGELDSFSAGQLRESFVSVLGRAGAVVDIREVPFVDSAGLGALVGGIRRLREAGTAVALCCTTPSVLRLLAMTGVDRIVAITPTVAEAHEMIAEAQLAGVDS